MSETISHHTCYNNCLALLKARVQKMRVPRHFPDYPTVGACPHTPHRRLCLFSSGASSGIGEAIAWRLAEAGVSLVVTARREERLQKLKADLEAKYGVPVYVQKLDMRDLDAIKALPTTLPAEFQKACNLPLLHPPCRC